MCNMNNDTQTPTDNDDLRGTKVINDTHDTGEIMSNTLHGVVCVRYWDGAFENVMLTDLTILG